MERFYESDFGKKPVELVKKPKGQLTKQAHYAIAKVALLMAKYKYVEPYFRENGLKDYKIKPLPPHRKLLYSTSHNAIRTSLEGYDYATKKS